MSDQDDGSPSANAESRFAGRKTVQGGARWRLRNWRLRTKLLAVLMVPMITAIALAGLRAKSELDRADQFDTASAGISATQDVVGLVHELQNERNLVVAFVAGDRKGDQAQMQGQIQRTNAGLTRLGQAVDEAKTANRERARFLAERLASVESVRAAATASAYPAIGVYGAYTALLQNVLQAGAEFVATFVDPKISRLAAATLAIVEAKEFLARQNAMLMIAGAKDAFPAGMLDEARAATASHSASINNFRANATSAEAQFYADTFSGSEVDDRERIRETAFNRGEEDEPLGIPLDRLNADAKFTADAMRDIERTLMNNLRSLSTTSAEEALANAWRDAIIVFIAILLAIAVGLLVARSLLVPLRVLRRDALDVANRRLPETVQRILADPDPVEASKNAVDPVPVFTREETGQLARSFDAVHDQAVRMATEQALLRDNINSIFVNLSRRSQTLVERQLSLIDRLEQDEQDPDQLASLFELDHLATRMRRNSESLLVLSGSGLSRQLSRPVPAAEVVGAAVSEVEQYARIEVVSAPEIAVQGRAVSDLVHLIAELLDNATSFSEPEKKVFVRMAITRKKELAIQITDAGVGMTEDEIESANARLADPPDLDVAVTRRMGLYVVARLAKRHDIKVRLRDNEDIEGGLIARITVPAGLVQTQAAGSTPTSTISQTPSLGDTAVKASSIAGAFTGNMPRVRPDTTPESETQVNRPVEEVASYPPFDPVPGGGFTRNVEDTGGWGPPASEAEINATLNGHGHGYDSPLDSIALFGTPLPEPDGGFEPRSFGETTAYTPVTPRDAEQPAIAGDAPTERLPIYEAVLSQWFEAGETNGHGQRAVTDDEHTDDEDHPRSGDLGDLDNTESTEQQEPAQAEEPFVDPWDSPGDDGWSRARALLDTSNDTAKTTAGLPKRVPKAHLVPGSAAPREDDEDQPAGFALPPRTADAVRGRMSSFQQGVRRGRHALIDAYAGDQSGSDESRLDEEQE